MSTLMLLQACLTVTMTAVSLNKCTADPDLAPDPGPRAQWNLNYSSLRALLTHLILLVTETAVYVTNHRNQTVCGRVPLSGLQ